METLHNQELVATILEDNVASELTTIQDFLRWTYSTFNRSDIYYGQGHDNAWDESTLIADFYAKCSCELRL